MTAQIRWLWIRLNANYWFYPALFAVAGVALALGLLWLDRHGFAARLSDLEAITPARPDGAANMLTVIAGSMIGVASTVFSITIAAVAYASGTYGPRLLTNFMEDKGNQLSLAAFIGTFVYALTVLRTVRAEDEMAVSAADAVGDTLPGFVPQLSLLVAYVLMALSVAVLVFFLNHIPASIRINTVLEGIGRRLIDQVRKDFAQPNDGRDAVLAPGGVSVPVRQRAGYIQMIDLAALDRLAARAKGAVTLKVRTGDFVHPGMCLADLAIDAVPEEAAAELHEAFVIGAMRTATHNPDFLIDELVEIALRALSPGINDPFTAITALHWLGAATAEMGQRNLTRRLPDTDGPQRVFPLPDSFAYYVERGFGRARGAVATSAAATMVALDTLCHASLPIDDAGRRDALLAEGGRLVAQARLALAGPDLTDVEKRYASFTERFA